MTEYEVRDRVHAGRARRVRSDEIAATVSECLDDLARAVRR